MATSTYTQYGKSVVYGLTELSGALITSATITYAHDTKEYADHTGTVVAIVTDLNPRFEAEITVTALNDSSTAVVADACAAWLLSQVTGSPFCSCVNVNGTAIVNDIKVEGKNDDATTFSVSAVYYPYVEASEE